MSLLRLRHNPFSILWIVLLSSTLLLTQNLQLHIHSFDHGPVEHHDESMGHGDFDHDHILVKHLSIDFTHADHHHDLVLDEVESVPSSTIQPISTTISPLDAIASLILLFTLWFYHSDRPRHHYHYVPLPERRHNLTPQLRAPPR